jgi:hypothetical protein
MTVPKKKKRHKRNPLDTLYRKRDRALERVVAIYENGEAEDEELNTALDVLTLTHAAATFEFVGGWVAKIAIAAVIPPFGGCDRRLFRSEISIV